MKSVASSVIILTCAVLSLAQSTVDQRQGSRPTEEEIAASKRREELFRHPTFITLRLLSSPRDVPHDAATDTPAPSKVKDYIGLQLFITQNSSETMRLGITSPYYDYRPELMKDGELVSYSENAAARVKRAENYPHSGSVSSITLPPGEERWWNSVSLDDWYDPLAPGRYQVTVRKQFAWGGDWAVSNPVYFEVIPKPIPAAIPDGINIEIVPEGANLNQKINNVSADTILQVFTRNTSDLTVKVNTVDVFYSLRPQLFKDNVLIPYRLETAKLVKSREEGNPFSVQLRDEIFLEPGSRTGLTYIRLADWYAALTPGSYRLTVRQRFEIDGPWTPESAPLLFEVVASKDK